MTWENILTHFPALEADLFDIGIDLESGILQERSWRWLTNKVGGLFSKFHFSPDGTAVPTTRLGLALKPPKPRARKR